MLIENDRRNRVERRMMLSGPPVDLFERRKALQRRLLDIGVLSFDSWMVKRLPASEKHHHLELTPNASGNEGLASGLF